MKTCKLSIGQLSQRMQLRSYLGPAATAIAGTYNFTYAASDVVPTGKFWLMLGASVVLDTNGVAEAPNQVPEFYLLKAGAIVPPNANQPYKQQAIFGSHVLGASSPSAICNGIPVDPAYAVRIDDAISNDVTQPGGQGSPQVVNLLRGRVPVIFGPGQAAMVTNHGNNTGGGIHAQMTLSILIIELDQNDTFDWL